MVSKFERGKDTVQELTESGATHVGKIAMIITGAVRDVTREIGDFLSDGIEMREASKKARADESRAERGNSESDASEPDGATEPQA